MDEMGRTPDARLKYLPSATVEKWNQLISRAPPNTGSRKKAFQRELDLTRQMHEAGVQFMAGTDAGSQYVGNCPGFTLHDELALLVKAGFSPWEVLQTATCNPARFLGKLDSFGTIQVGRIADLVLLEANPLEDIANTQRIGGVVLNGRFLPKETLHKMLAEVELAAKK